MQKIRLFVSTCYLFIGPLLPIIAMPQDAEVTSYVNTSAVTEDAGTYPIVISYDDQNGTTVSYTIYITAYRYRTVENTEKHEAIDAHDIILGQKSFTNITDENLILLANAHAWNTLNGQTIPIATVIRSVKDNKIGLYEVAFATEDKTTVTITVLEKNQKQPSNVVDSTTTYLFFSHKGDYVYLETILFVLLFLTFIIVNFSVFQIEKNA